jgi:transglycosylase-like protein
VLGHQAGTNDLRLNDARARYQGEFTSMDEWTDGKPRQVGAPGVPSPWQSQWARSLSSENPVYDDGYDGYDAGNGYQTDNRYETDNGYEQDSRYGSGNGYQTDNRYETDDRYGAGNGYEAGNRYGSDTAETWAQSYDGDDDGWDTGGYYDEPEYRDRQMTPAPSGDTPDDDSSGNDLRRVLIGGAAGVAMLVGPIVLAHVIVPSDGDVEADDSTAVASRQQLRESALLEDQARSGSAQAATTTTTVPPPTTTTTAPPTTTTTAPPTTTSTAPPVEVPPNLEGSGQLGDPYFEGSWDQLADCEAGGNWQINTGNGYYGGLQFSLSSWQAVGGQGYPHENSRETQIAMGQRLYESSGWGAWPACTAEFGWR